MKKAITYIFLITAMFFAAVTVLPAQNTDEAVPAGVSVTEKPVVNLDTAKLQPRKFNETTIEKLQKDDDYRYDYTPPSNEKSLWEKFWEWVLGDFDSPQRETVDNSFDVVMWIIIIFAVGMLIYLLVGGNFTNIIKGSAKTTAAVYNITDLDINAIDYDKLITQALTEKDYRTAVRLYYLQTLKVLSDKNLIAWQPDKTNSQYLNELKQAEMKQQFAGITYIYEYVWYGGFDLDESRFKSADKAFSEFNRNIGK